MTPDSDSFTHILLNGALWVGMLLGPIGVIALVGKMRDAWADYKTWEAERYPTPEPSNVRVLRGER